jgi:hypothetical protein
MRGNRVVKSRRTAQTRFKVRLKVAIGVGAVLVASPFAAAAVPHGSMVASHSARVGSSRNVLVSLAASNSLQGTKVLAASSKTPATLWPHWGTPKA